MRLIWPHLPEDACDGLDLDVDGLLPGASFANMETAVMTAKNWERERTHALGRSAHLEGVSGSGENKAFLRLDTIEDARIGWLADQKVFFYRYSIRHRSAPEFMVYPARDRFEIALVLTLPLSMSGVITRAGSRFGPSLDRRRTHSV